MKNFVLIWTMGLVYLTLEIFSRWLGGAMLGFQVGDMIQSRLSLSGWTSIWMLPVGGVVGLIIGKLNEGKFHNMKIIVQSFIGLLITWAIELSSGLLLNKLFKLGVWDYTHERFNFMGQICLETGIMFLAIMPFVIWLDDFIKWAFYRKNELYNPLYNYKKFITLK